FALRFLLATNHAALTQVLGIVYRTISAHILKKARLTRASGGTGAVTLIQRFGSALNLNTACSRRSLGRISTVVAKAAGGVPPMPAPRSSKNRCSTAELSTPTWRQRSRRP